VFAIPAVQSVAACRPGARVFLVGPSGVCDLLRGMVPWETLPLDGARIGSRLATAWRLRSRRPDLAVVFPESFSSALEAWVAGAPRRLGRPTQGRRALLTDPIGFGARPRTRHVVDEYLDLARAVGGSIGERTPHLILHPEDVRAAEGLLPDGGEPWRLGLVPGARYGPAKRWPPERFADLARRFGQRRGDGEVVLFGSAEERFLCEWIASRVRGRVVSVAGRTRPGVLAACLARCSLVVGNDTGPTHVAAAVGTPVVAVFGSTNPVWTAPVGARQRVVRRPVECSPCYLRRCDRGYPCLAAITVDDVWDACRELEGRPQEGAVDIHHARGRQDQGRPAEDRRPRPTTGREGGLS